MKTLREIENFIINIPHGGVVNNNIIEKFHLK